MYVLYLCIVTGVLEFINYSLQSKANINDDHLDQALVVQKVDNAIRRINLYPLDSDLSSG